MMENQISIEEMKAAVLTECERLCPNDGDCSPISTSLCLIRHSAMLYDIMGETIIDYARIPKVLVEVTAIVGSAFPDWDIAYRLLGLEAKAKDAEIQRLRDECDSIERKYQDVYNENINRIRAEHVDRTLYDILIEASKMSLPMVNKATATINVPGYPSQVHIHLWAAVGEGNPIEHCKNLLTEISKLQSKNERLSTLAESYITMLEAELKYHEDEEAKFNLEVLLENARVALKGGGTND